MGPSACQLPLRTPCLERLFAAGAPIATATVSATVSIPTATGADRPCRGAAPQPLRS